MPHWTKILIHDSYDNKGRNHTSDEMLQYHLGWKDLSAGEPLSEDIAMHLIEHGESKISRPWKECGDHWHVVQEKGEWHIRMMRPMTSNGAHAKEYNLNKNAISVRIVPDTYSLSVDEEKLYDRLTVLCKFLMKTYHIPVDKVQAHHEAVYGSDCPKAWFLIEEFRTHLISSLFKQ